MDEEIRHIDSPPGNVPSFTSLALHCTSLYLSLSPIVCQSTLTKCNGIPALLSPSSSSSSSSSSTPTFYLPFLCKKKKKRKKKIKLDKKMSFVSLLTWKLLFYTESRLGFLFSNIWMLEVLYWRKKKTKKNNKTQNIIIIIRIVLQLYSMYSHFLSGTWNKHAEEMLWLCFPCFFVFCRFNFFFVFVINMLSAWNRKVCVNGSFMLFNFLWFCLYCMYFFKGFWGRPQKYRSACERGRTCIFTGYPPPLQLQSGLLCTCITEAPNKTHCGWLVRKKTKNAGLCLGLCSIAASALLTFTPAHRFMSPLIIKLYSQKTSAQTNLI